MSTGHQAGEVPCVRLTSWPGAVITPKSLYVIESGISSWRPGTTLGLLITLPFLVLQDVPISEYQKLLKQLDLYSPTLPKKVINIEVCIAYSACMWIDHWVCNRACYQHSHHLNAAIFMLNSQKYSRAEISIQFNSIPKYCILGYS